MRLIDCFTPIITNTLRLLADIKRTQPEFEKVRIEIEQRLTDTKGAALNMGFSVTEFDQAFFAVCAWLDEAIINSSWEHNREWEDLPLQKIHYFTTNAGEEFFTRLKQISDSELGVLEVYATLLTLGFKGRYFAIVNRPRLAEITKTTIARVVGRSPDPELYNRGRLFPEAYRELAGMIEQEQHRSSTLFTALEIVFSVGLIVALYLYFDMHLESIVATTFGY